MDEKTLEFGFQEVSSRHINSFNLNLDSKRKQHLQQARKVFLTRLKVVENTLLEMDSRLDVLRESIPLTQTYLS